MIHILHENAYHPFLEFLVIKEQGIKIFILIIAVYQDIINAVIVGKMKVLERVVLALALRRTGRLNIAAKASRLVPSVPPSASSDSTPRTTSARCSVSPSPDI